MSELLDIASILTNECQLAPETDCIVVGVSGGPDSLALLHRLAALKAQAGWQIHVAHLDHGLRGTQSAAEAEFVATTAATWGLTATLERQDVAAMAREYGVGLPAAARAARYAFLARVALEQQAGVVAVAHQANDQAETVLHHLVRGAGPSGLSGMLPRVEWPDWRHVAGRAEAGGPALIRPLLFTERSAITQYCQQFSLEPRYDPSNASVEHARGQLRHKVLPLIKQLNPQVVAALGRTARLASLEADFMHQALAQEWPTLVALHPGEIQVRRERWLALHPALQRLAVRAIVQQLRPERETLSAAQLDAALHAMYTEQIVHQLPHNLVLNRNPHGWVFLMSTTTRAGADEPQLLVQSFAINRAGVTVLPGGQWRIHCAELPGRPEANLTRWQVLLDADGLQGQLELRQRQPGDRIHPAGGIGSRRVQDIMVDMRLPRELRPQWPLLADTQGLVWLPGLVVAERVHPGNATTHFLFITLEELERHAS